MVLTRSRTNSPAQRPETSTETPAAAEVEMMESPRESTEVRDAPGPVMAPAQPVPVVMTDSQLALLLSQIGSRAAPVPAMQSNFAACTHRFDGKKNVIPFLEAIEIYKESVAMTDAMAMRGLPMLLTDFAAEWWQGVKHSVTTWSEALALLRNTYGPRLPPHMIYKELFRREQGDENTDVFVCKSRALLSQLPANTIPEDPVQLDMVYGLLHRRIRRQVARTSFSSFQQLLELARVVEELEEECPAVTKTEVTSSEMPTRSESLPQDRTTDRDATTNRKARLRCNYCKQFGHMKDECQKGQRKKQNEQFETEQEERPESTKPTVTCFGCGLPGVIRSNCPNCKSTKSDCNVNLPAFAAFSPKLIDVCMRPKLGIEILGLHGSALVDTGAKQSVASDSLYRVLVEKGQKFDTVKLFISLADGSKQCRIVKTAKVNVKVHAIVVPTLFIVIPGATDSLLGMDFIQDSGMILNFTQNCYSFRSHPMSYQLRYETEDPVGACAAVSPAVDLRGKEGELLQAADRELLKKLRCDKGIFKRGGAPTTSAVQHKGTGENVPVTIPPYHVSPVKKRSGRRIGDMLSPLKVQYPSRIKEILQQKM
ncbi:uncharacterized protein LOC114353992 isoform X2 [Ostrinia furnacalis]|uniref:uncharacterized protein LOC114353992 isoform X2 n=1 Tax=Ostrinia furnacalis TaxID=93504 RepID=UPI00103FD4A7|nr:uncharacterized protein LOC114353992 isoform X2 [Ostrinia furnacalis]